MEFLGFLWWCWLLMTTITTKNVNFRDQLRGGLRDNNTLWWEHTIVYQIYPRSFQDSDGDGTGDLKGIESRLDHFVDLGVETIWLSPIYESPMRDFGYDVSNFTDIDPIFGNLEDFTDLVEAVHNRGMKIVMDFIPNHSSNEHEWFQKPILREDPYTDYYVWADSLGTDENGNRIPPNNWTSVFRGRAWEYNEMRGQFYFHQYLVEQPDLNYRNPAVMQEMKDILFFWMEKGVDGFRFDAIIRLWEDEQLLDEPYLGGDPEAYNSYDHIYTYNQPQVKDVLNEMYQAIKNYSQEHGHDRVDMLEVYLPINEIMEFYNCSDYPFNFYFIEKLETGEPLLASNIKGIIDAWMDNLPNGRIASWVIGNHDNWRVGTRLGKDAIDIMNMIIMTLPGVAVTYQGEEIGMVNGDISYEQTVDPKGCNCGPVNFNDEGCSRDPERTPMQWDNTENAGFTSPGVTPWLPVNSNHHSINVEAERGDPFSHLSIYKAVVGLRNSAEIFKVGMVKTVLSESQRSLSIGRFLENQNIYDTFVTVINFSHDQEDQVNIFQEFHPTIANGLVEISPMGNLGYNPAGSVVDLHTLLLHPGEAIIIRLFEVPLSV